MWSSNSRQRHHLFELQRETGSVCNCLTKSHKVIVTVNLSASCILSPIYAPFTPHLRPIYADPHLRRWEHEVFYRELKLQVAQGDLLQSHTPETAVQEIAALLMACALVAQERLAVAAEVGGEVEAAGAVRISLSICLEYTQALWIVWSAAQGLMDKAAQQELVRRMRQQIAAFALPPRRPRSCDRKVRQPIKKGCIAGMMFYCKYNCTP